MSEDCFTIIGRFEDSGETSIAVIQRDADHADPHWAALKHTARLSDSGDFEVVALLRGRCDILVTQQSLRLFAERLLAQE
jgi:hypothetical protein